MVKRLLDLIISIFCIVILSPFFCILPLLIFIESPGPIIFSQKRVGKKEKSFNIYKFRSMYVHNLDPSEIGAVKHSHPLVTKIGYIMRRTKLDEIPQFFNVLRGDMSLVGPRPCMFERIKNMTSYERHRFLFLPGMTGWAEVNGNVEFSWDEQLLLDLWYIDHQSLWLDFVILARTFVVLFIGSIRNDEALNRARSYVRNS